MEGFKVFVLDVLKFLKSRDGAGWTKLSPDYGSGFQSAGLTRAAIPRW
jgi:hypothetical protein